MSIVKKARRYMRKADRLSTEFTGYMEQNPLVAVGLALAVGTMFRAMGGEQVAQMLKTPQRPSAS